jgi:hypothetical protein
MRTPQRTAQIRDEAVALRLAGKSVREIREALGPVGKRTLSAALKGTPPAEWTRRPNAKDDLREQSADADAAQQFWLKVTGTQSSQFRSPALKRHNPKTHRTNVGENYRGCLRIDVRRSAVLYRKIEGWASVAMTGRTLSAA